MPEKAAEGQQASAAQNCVERSLAETAITVSKMPERITNSGSIGLPSSSCRAALPGQTVEVESGQKQHCNSEADRNRKRPDNGRAR